MSEFLQHNDFLTGLVQLEKDSFSSVDYVGVSKPRFDYTLALCREICPRAQAKILDIGRSEQSYMLSSFYSDVTTLGFPITNEYGHEQRTETWDGQPRNHLVFDLNCAQSGKVIEADCKFDLIVFSEVIEHIYTAPELVLNVLKGVLSEGGVIVCLTPNAVAVKKRLLMLRGKNPYERIRFDSSNPGHFREYTKEELVSFGETCKLKVCQHTYRNFSEQNRTSNAQSILKKILYTIAPSLMPHQVLVYKNDQISSCY